MTAEVRAASCCQLTARCTAVRHALPDRCSYCIGPDHRIPRLASERLCKLGHVRDGTVGPPAAGRVRIGENPLTLILRRDVLSPDLRPGQEESLLRCKSVD